MANKELIDYIKNVKDQGYDDQVIMEHLVKHGYQQKDVSDAFLNLNRKFDKVFLMMIVMIIILAVLVIIFIGNNVFIRMSEDDPICEDVAVNLYTYEDINYFCSGSGDKVSIQLPISNAGRRKIDGLVFRMIGKKIYKIDEDIAIDVEEVYPAILNYDSNKYGNLNSIEIIPEVNENGKIIRCNNKNYVLENITCID